MGKDHCPGTCKKKESQAKNVSVTDVSAPITNCPKLTSQQAQAAIQADVIDDNTYTTELEKCKDEKCPCVYPSWDKPDFNTLQFDWDLREEVEVTVEGKKKKITCDYKIAGTVEVATRVVEGFCRGKKVKGKTTKKLG